MKTNSNKNREGRKSLGQVGKALVLALGLVLGGIGLALGWSAIWGHEGIRARQEVSETLTEVQLQLNQAREENRKLQVQIDRLHEDIRAQKDEIRRVLGLLGRDEVILVPENSDNPNQDGH